MHLRSERLTLRPATHADVPDIFAAVTPELTRYLSFDPAPCPEALEEVVAAWQPVMATGEEFHVVLRGASTGCFIGMVGARAIASPFPELGIWIREAEQRRGYGREAVAALCDWLSAVYRPTGFHYLAAEANLPSHRIARSLGGIETGFREHRKYRAVVYRLPLTG